MAKKTPDEPLTMTVHSLPSLDDAQSGNTVNVRAGRWKLLLLLLVGPLSANLPGVLKMMGLFVRVWMLCLLPILPAE